MSIKCGVKSNYEFPNQKMTAKWKEGIQAWEGRGEGHVHNHERGWKTWNSFGQERGLKSNHRQNMNLSYHLLHPGSLKLSPVTDSEEGYFICNCTLAICLLNSPHSSQLTRLNRYHFNQHFIRFRSQFGNFVYRRNSFFARRGALRATLLAWRQISN